MTDESVEHVQYMNSGAALNPHDLEAPMKLFVPKPTPLRLCRVCNQGRSGLPGDDHAACRRQEATWRAHVQTVLPEVQAAYAAARMTEDAARALLVGAGVPGWLINEEFGDEDD